MYIPLRYLKAIVYISFIIIVYGFIYSQFPKHAFEFKDPILDPYYFSITTLSGSGYGDYTPKTRLAKLFVMSEMLLIVAGIISWFHEQ